MSAAMRVDHLGSRRALIGTDLPAHIWFVLCLCRLVAMATPSDADYRTCLDSFGILGRARINFLHCSIDLLHCSQIKLQTF